MEAEERDFRTMAMYSETAKTFTTLATAALVVPITFIREVLGVPKDAPIILDPFLIASWVLFLIAIGLGLLYQYLAVKHVGRTKTSPFFVREPGYVYGVMMASFYLGALSFTIGAWSRLNC